MRALEHLVEWDQLDFRVRGSRVQELTTDLLQQKGLPVSDLRLEFLEARLEVSARIKKGLSIPFSFTVSTIRITGKTLQVPLENVTTFGILPIPKVLFRLIGELNLPDGITLNLETLTLTVWLDQLLPRFIDLTLESIRLIPGGLAVRLGRGGADFPV